MDPTRLPNIMINWKPVGRKKRGRPRRTSKDGIYTAKRSKNGRMEQLKAMGYGSRKALPDVLKPHIYTHTHTHTQGVPGGMCQTSGECSLS